MVVAALGVVLLRSLRRGRGVKKASGVGRLEPKNSSASTQGLSLVHGMVLSEVR